MEGIEDIIEILALCDEEIKNNDENVTATLDLQDLKALKRLWDLYNKKIEEYNKLKQDYQELDKETNVFCDMWLHKDKIRNKIEEWDKSIKWNNADDHYYAINILKELLEA